MYEGRMNELNECLLRWYRAVYKALGTNSEALGGAEGAQPLRQPHQWEKGKNISRALGKLEGDELRGRETRR
jgi:hypothetical protein